MEYDHNEFLAWFDRMQARVTSDKITHSELQRITTVLLNMVKEYEASLNSINQALDKRYAVNTSWIQ